MKRAMSRLLRASVGYWKETSALNLSATHIARSLTPQHAQQSLHSGSLHPAFSTAACNNADLHLWYGSASAICFLRARACPSAMAECSITSVQVLNNPAQFTEPIVLEVQYECLSSLQDDLEWRVVYVGSADSDDYDQVLDSALVGPVQQGNFKFRMEAPAPDPSKIPVSDLLGVTALLLTCSYKSKEFVRVGYYVNVEYTDLELPVDEQNRTILPNPPRIDKLQRNIMADHPRVTKFPHDFDNAPAAPPAEADGEPDADDLLPDDDEGEEYEDEEEYDEEYDDREGAMDEVDLQGEGLENQDPNGQPALGAGAQQLQGKAGLAAAVAEAGAGVEDMEL